MQFGLVEVPNPGGEGTIVVTKFSQQAADPNSTLVKMLRTYVAKSDSDARWMLHTLYQEVYGLFSHSAYHTAKATGQLQAHEVVVLPEISDFGYGEPLADRYDNSLNTRYLEERVKDTWGYTLSEYKALSAHQRDNLTKIAEAYAKKHAAILPKIPS